MKKIDLVLVKSISRFARNALDCLNYTRALRALGIAVVFEKENISTADRVRIYFLGGIEVEQELGKER